MKEIINIRTDAIQSPLNLAVAQSNRAAASKCEDCSAQEDEHMSDGLDVIVLDDDPGIGEILSELIESFYTWGEVHCFTELNKAISFCLTRDIGVAIFVVDVFLGGLSGFSFLDAIDEKYPTAHEDAIIISGNANEDVVNMCLASNVN